MSFSIDVSKREMRLRGEDLTNIPPSKSPYYKKASDIIEMRPLHLAIEHTNKILVRLLLNYGADVNGQMKFKTAHGTEGHCSPLHLAVYREDSVVIKQL